MFRLQPPTPRFFDPLPASASFLIVALVLLIVSAIRQVIVPLARALDRLRRR